MPATLLASCRYRRRVSNQSSIRLPQAPAPRRKATEVATRRDEVSAGTESGGDLRDTESAQRLHRRSQLWIDQKLRLHLRNQGRQLLYADQSRFRQPTFLSKGLLHVRTARREHINRDHHNVADRDQDKDGRSPNPLRPAHPGTIREVLGTPGPHRPRVPPRLVSVVCKLRRIPDRRPTGHCLSVATKQAPPSPT